MTYAFAGGGGVGVGAAMTEREASREKFEAFVREWRPMANLATNSAGTYRSQAVQHQFEVWQASRQQTLSEAVTRAVIHSQYPIDCDFDRGYAKARKDAAAAIRSLIPTKGPTP